MKHTLKITIALIAVFFLAQLTGLFVVNHYIDHKKTAVTKEIEWRPLPYNLERPEVKNKSASFVYISIAVLIGTLLVLLLMRFNKPLILKLWFFVTIWITLAIAFAAFTNSAIAALLALAVTILKLYKPEILVQNISEIFIYGGLAAIVVPIVNLFAAFMLLIIISVYDYVAVYKTRHMVKMAKFQSKSKIFAGLLMPYKREEAQATSAANEAKTKKQRVAVLGGGDIGFPLIFAGVVMKGLMLQELEIIGFLKSLIIPFCVTIALAVLLVKGEQNKFYPAMPILSFGCVVGYLIILLF